MTPDDREGMTGNGSLDTYFIYNTPSLRHLLFASVKRRVLGYIKDDQPAAQVPQVAEASLCVWRTAVWGRER